MNLDEILKLARDPETKYNVARLVYQLTPNPWNFRYIDNLLYGYRNKETWFNLLTVLHAFSRLTQPTSYLEVGVNKGASMLQVLSQSISTKCFGFDMWPPDYAITPDWKHFASSPEFVHGEMAKFVENPSIEFVSGDSQFTLPGFFNEHPDFIADLALVDGDHSEEGARRDLSWVFPRCKAIVFDDTHHPFHPYLESVWDEAFQKYGEGWQQMKDSYDVGTAIAIKCTS